MCLPCTPARAVSQLASVRVLGSFPSLGSELKHMLISEFRSNKNKFWTLGNLVRSSGAHLALWHDDNEGWPRPKCKVVPKGKHSGKIFWLYAQCSLDRQGSQTREGKGLFLSVAELELKHLSLHFGSIPVSPVTPTLLYRKAAFGCCLPSPWKNTHWAKNSQTSEPKT